MLSLIEKMVRVPNPLPGKEIASEWDGKNLVGLNITGAAVASFSR